MFGIKAFSFKKSRNTDKRPENDAWYNATLAECADGLWDLDLIKEELYLSHKLRDLIGYLEEETKNHSLQWWLDQIHPDDRPEIQRKVDASTHPQSEFIYFDAFRFLCKNGDYIWLENHARVLRSQRGDLIRIAGITFNLTPQKFIQNQLRTIISEQEKEAQNKQRFLSTLNHELRSPLTGIMGMTTLLKETNLSPDQVHYVETIENSTDMLLNLVNDILDVSKLNSGKFELETISFSLTQVIQQAVDLIRPTLIKKHLTFKILIKNEIPEHLIGDPIRIQQILINLLSNAAKFTIKGGITLLVKEVQEKQKHTYYFEVSDTGIGIARHVQEHLFEDFTQADTSINRMYGGTGLGLAICKELVHLMGGQIGVKSEQGKGSIFWFEVPFETPTTPILQNSTHETSPFLATQQSKLVILLVEDNLVNQEVMHGLLAHLGDQVTIASNGQEAITLFQTQKFDVVLMDLNMPVLDGLKATEAIRQLPNGNIPIIAVTANTFAKELEDCHQYGINHILNKPVNKASLEQALSPYRIFNPKKNKPIQEKASPQPLKSVDSNILRTLLSDLGKEKVIQLLNIYHQDALKLVDQIKNGSPKESKNYAHTLAGMSENLGIHVVGKTARDIMSASQQAPETIPTLVQDLEQYFDSYLPEIRSIVLHSKNDH